jgi:hypothetical protein
MRAAELKPTDRLPSRLGGRNWTIFRAVLSAVGLFGACSGCAVPAYDVPRDEYGQPTAKTIIERIQCEIRDMVRDDRPDSPASFHRRFLLNGDYVVLVALSLEVNDSGGLAPSVSYVNPVTAATSWTLGANATLSEARDHTFSENIELSTRQIYADWKSGVSHDCPAADTNLAGNLGLSDIVSMATSSPNLDESLAGGEKNGIFGGTIQFVVTKSLSAAGPSWQLVRFKNIAALASLSEVNTDKITLAFSQGSNKGKRLPQINGFNAPAYQFLQQQLLNSISSQLLILNTPR